MPFRDIKGQEHVVSLLQRLVQNGRVPHALLFTGPEGVGKRTTALSLAQSLNCLEPKAGDACGRCAACLKIAKGVHPDVRVLEPDGQFIKIETIRENLQQDAVLKPLEGRAKVYVLDPADALTPPAANSLLKILEEPPAAVSLILITGHPFALLPTILSRCQEVRFRPLAAPVLSGWLQQRLGCPPDTAQTLAMLSGGRPAEALRLSEPQWQDARQQVLAAASQAAGQDWAEAARQWAEFYSDLPEVLALLLTWYRDLLVLATGAPVSLVMNVDRLPDLQAFLARTGPEAILEKCRAILAAADQIARNLNAQLVLENMFMQLNAAASPTAG